MVALAIHFVHLCEIPRGVPIKQNGVTAKVLRHDYFPDITYTYLQKCLLFS